MQFGGTGPVQENGIRMVPNPMFEAIPGTRGFTNPLFEFIPGGGWKVFLQMEET